MAEINYKTATAMISLFDCVYKKGVYDAYNCAGADDLNRFVEMLSEAGMYGTCQPFRAFNWSGWRSCLHFWIMDITRYKPHLREYLMDVWQCKGVAACLYPISFDFYAQGVLDYIGNSSGASLMNNFMKIRKINFAKYVKERKTTSISIDDYISIVHNFAQSRIHKVQTLGRKKGERLVESDYTKFAESFWRVLTARRVHLRTVKEKRLLDKAKMDRIAKDISNGERTDD